MRMMNAKSQRAKTKIKKQTHIHDAVRRICTNSLRLCNTFSAKKWLIYKNFFMRTCRKEHRDNFFCAVEEFF